MSKANELKTHAVEFLTARGWTVWVNNSGQIKSGQYMVRLSPDFTGDVIGYDVHGRYVHVEVKVGGDKLSPGQIDELWRLSRTMHAVTCVATSKKQLEAWYDWLVRTR